MRFCSFLLCIKYNILSFFPFLTKDNMEEVGATPPEKVGCFHRSEFSVKGIFTDNRNWDRYYYFHRREVRPVEREEVEKMMGLGCKGPDRGCYVYHCPKCGEYHSISFGCNSRLCSDCGKRYTDQWAKRLSSGMFGVPHRHAVLTLPTDHALC